MKVLDIHPNCCWSFIGPDSQTIWKLRVAVSLPDERTREYALRGIPRGKAFRFVGEPIELDLADRFFDEVNLKFAPEVSKRGRMRQCVRRWSKSYRQLPLNGDEQSESGAYSFSPARFLERWTSISTPS